MTLLYMLSFLAHFSAIIYGVKAVGAGEHLFVNSSPFSILTSRVEQKYWTVCFGLISNLIFVSILPLYMVADTYYAIGWLNIPFAIFHCFDGGITFIWHRLTYLDIISGKLGAVNVGKYN